MTKIKPALSISELVEILKENGLKISNEDLAKSALKNFTYYRLVYYFKKFKNGQKCFSANCSLSDILDYYYFDHWLRIFILNLLGPIEIYVRSNLAQYLAMEYGALAFYKPNRYQYNKNYQISKKSFIDAVENRDYDPVIKHHKEVYESLFPIWVVVQYLTFSNISRLFSSLYDTAANDLSDLMYRNYKYKKLDGNFVKSWLHSLCDLRNLCAHHVPLFDRTYIHPPRIRNLFSPWPGTENESLFALFLVMKRISNKDFWDECMTSFESHLNDKDKIDLRNYGFPSDWKDYLITD